MFSFNIKFVLGLILSLFANVFLTGCAPQALPKEFAGVGRALVDSISEQAVWEKVAGNIDGEVIEPGIEIQAGIIYVARAKITGAAGRVGLRAEGSGSGKPVSPETMQHIREQNSEAKPVDELKKLGSK